MPKLPAKRPRAVVDWKSRQREVVVRTPAMSFKARIQKSIRPFNGPKPIWQTLSRLGNATSGTFDLSRQPALRLANVAGLIVENPALRNMVYGEKRSSVFAGNLWENLERTWQMYNHRLGKQRAGKLGPAEPLVTPKEAEALRVYLGTLWQRLAVKVQAEGL